MTVQIPEKLHLEMLGIDIKGYKLYDILIGNPSDYINRTSYKFKQKGQQNVIASHCRRGYVSTYVLEASGQLRLTEFDYPFGDDSDQPDKADEILEGDFWLDLRTEFLGSTIYLPFVDGAVVTDKTKWIYNIR